MTQFKRVRKSRESGVTSIEYGLLAALIALSAILGFTALGNANEGRWTDWVDKVIAVVKGG